MVWFAKLRQIAPGPQKDLLGRIAGIGFVSEDRQGRPEGRRKPSVDEVGERFVVAAPGALDEEPFRPFGSPVPPGRLSTIVMSPSLCRVQRMTPLG